MKKKDIKVLLFIILLWIGLTTTVQRFKCAKLSETELFLRIPSSFMLDFKICD